MSVEQLIEQWDGEEVVIHGDAPSGATFVIARHCLRGGRAIGGTRIKAYPELADAVRDAIVVRMRTSSNALGPAPFARGWHVASCNHILDKLAMACQACHGQATWQALASRKQAGKPASGKPASSKQVKFTGPAMQVQERSILIYQ